MRTIYLTIPGEPVAQGRPIFSTRGGHVRAYDPSKSSDWKQYAKLVAQQTMGDMELLQGKLSLSVRVYRHVPKSMSKKNQKLALSGDIRPTTKPDLDNYVKGASDALEGIVFANDSSIVAFHGPFGKWFSDKPRIVIEIKEI